MRGPREDKPVRYEPLGRGLYVSGVTVDEGERLEPIARRAEQVGIRTLVVDLWRPSDNYARAIRKLQDRGFLYVPRIVVFPSGGTEAQVRSHYYWELKWKLVEYTLGLGGEWVQLDYIRYHPSVGPRRQNALDIREVIRFFRKRVHEHGARLQVDVFGEVAKRPSLRIGQDLSLFAPEIDGVCPMTYPSHFKPYDSAWKQPYETVYEALAAAKRQIDSHSLRMDPYIEMFHYKHPMPEPDRAEYIRAQMRAVNLAGADGWYAWSATNRYELLFDILERYGDYAEA